MRAVPAVVEENKDGCWLRYGDSASTWWAGATLLHGNARSRQLVRRTKCGTCRARRVGDQPGLGAHVSAGGAD